MFKMLYYNKLFKIIEIKIENSDKKFIFPSLKEGILIKILLKGKIYYHKKFILEENQYVIENISRELKKEIILSKELNIYLIVISPIFLKKMNILNLEKPIHNNLDIEIKNFLHEIDKNHLNNNSLSTFTFVLNFFKIHNLIHNVYSENKNLDYYKNIFAKMSAIIDKNLTLHPNEIKKIIYINLEIKEIKMKEVMYQIKRTTLKKYILRKKVEKIIEEYLKTNNKLSDISKNYSFNNIKTLRYHIQKFYSLNLKDLKQLKKYHF